MIDSKNLIWFNETAKITSSKARKYLLDNSSLTAKLKQKYPDFRVKLLSEKKANINANENDIFTELNTDFYIREVLLFGNNKPVVFARSVIPDNKEVANILGLGNKPLGEVLFNNDKIKRGLIQYTKTNNNIWAKRSVFYLQNSKILVCEFFL